MKYSSENVGKTYMFIAMVLSGTIGYFALESKQAAENIVFVRCVLGALALGTYAYFFNKLPERKQIDSRTLVLLLIGGVTLVFNWLFLFNAYQSISIGLTTVIYNTQPFFLLILGAVVLNESIQREHVFLMLIAFSGLTIMVMSEPQSGSSVNVTGVLHSLSAAILYAISTIYTKKVTNLAPEFIAVTHLIIGAVVFSFLIDVESYWNYPERNMNLVILGLVHTGIMYIFLYGAYEKTSVASLAVISFVYPIVALIIDVIVYDLSLSFQAILGTTIMLGSIVAYNLNLFSRRRLKNA